jgi:hypothetical protein
MSDANGSRSAHLPTQLRLGVEADVPRIVDMGVRMGASTEYAKFIHDPLEVVRARFEVRARQLLEEGRLYVVERGDDLLGMVGAIVGEHPLLGGKTCFEVMWWVEPHARKGRSGAVLLMAIETLARAEHCVRIAMGSPNAEVTQLLQRVQFTPVEVTMVKTLDYSVRE